MYEELISRVLRKQAEFDFELARTTDPYRLAHLLDEYAKTIAAFQVDANQMVKELEDI